MTDKFIRIRYSVPSSCPRISPSRMPIEKTINSREIKEICAGPTIYFMEIHGQDKQIPLTREQYDYIAAQLVDLYPNKPIIPPITAPITDFDFEGNCGIYGDKYVGLKNSLHELRHQVIKEIELSKSYIDIEKDKCRPNNVPFYGGKIDALSAIQYKLNKLLEES